MNNTTDNPRAALARRADLVVQEMPDEVLVYDLKQHKAHCLNKTAAFVWQHCDGQTTVPQLAGLLRQDSGAPVDEDVIWYALDKLHRAELLEVTLPSPSGAAISRRRLIRGLGVGAVLAIPAVISLVAPTAAQTATVIITPKKVADGTCSSPPGPSPGPNCLLGDTCCTGSKRICVQTGSSPLSSNCVGPACEPAGAASDC